MYGQERLHRVVEKCLAFGRRNFEYVPGTWRETLEQARLDAEVVARTTLAHRLFICRCGGNGPAGNVVLEIELPPLADRMRASDDAIRRMLASGRRLRRS